ncbi:ubiquitin carboxyl-terminal hydrolase 2 isoform X2 [Prosopis cineraria]|uniref:ubiquitin carboxyl-terminal hydrolase 2 isoform X2 n=1 Tax=Prosopis cineraria TaxID=364024 RepID=UPI00241056ED|nr:ubiquitin carboxyl-terminal hydrolase 2 isoform X2 [Prosopis cineraria]
MGKRVRNKRQGSAKEKRDATHTPKKVVQSCNPTVAPVNDAVSLVEEIKSCPHLKKSVNLTKLSVKIGPSRSIGMACEDCRESATDRRGNKKKGKHASKKGTASEDLKPESKAIWICLECGRYTCGGAGLPATPQCHAIKHSRQSRHPLVVNSEKPQLCWCFVCDMFIPVEKTEQNDEKNHVLSDVVTLLKARPSDQSLADVEDLWFGNGSITAEIKSGALLTSDSYRKAGYIVRGMSNLGNTCFFNSIMQNLLAMSKLRDNFLKLDAPAGPLTSSLKKLFVETNPDSGLKSIINPRSFFCCVCSKSPQFRGYQQHDSHELLCCLLEGLGSEELAARKQKDAPEKDGILSNVPTLVDALFGGQLSSTVCCVECGHASVVHEPFLDLSLPVPSKKSPPKKAPLASRSKKAKFPPKKGGKARVKVSRDVGPLPAQSLATKISNDQSSCPVQSNISFEEEVVASSGESTVFGPVNKSTPSDYEVSSSPNFLTAQNSDHTQVLENGTEKASNSSGDFTWLDYVEAGTMTDESGFFSQNKDVAVIQDNDSKEELLNEYPVQTSCESSSQICFPDEMQNLRPDSSLRNGWEDEVPLQVEDTKVLLLPYKEESSLTREITGRDGEASSTVLGCGQEDLGFEGFGDLFDEPEVVAGPAPRPVNNEVGVNAGNSSESDPDEVDDTDSPVSVDSCLAHFIKPELLSNENAWHCENCSKILHREKVEAKTQKNRVSNGEETVRNADPQHTTNSCYTMVGTGNGNVKNDQVKDSLVSDVKDCRELENGQTDELNTVINKGEDETFKEKDIYDDESSGFCQVHKEENGLAADSCSVQHATGDIQERNSQLLNHENNDSRVTKDEEVDTKSVKVKRNATRSILIYKAPPVLTIHLKRFSQDIRGRLSKLSGHVSFKETIDLRPYMDPRGPKGEGERRK